MLRRILPAFVLVCTLVPVAASADEAMKSTLSSIPKDALCFVCIPNIKALDSDFRQAVSDLGLEQIVQLPSGSILGLLTQQMPAFEGIDENGSFSIVVMPASTFVELPTKAAFLVSAKDPKGMIEAMGGVASEDGLWTVTLFGQPAFAAIHQGRVVLGPLPDLIKAITTAESGIEGKLKAPEIAALEGVDAAIWLDGEKLAGLLRPMVESVLFPIMDAQASAGPFGPKSGELNKRNLGMLLDGLASMTSCVTLDRRGLGMRFNMMCRPGSDLAKQTKLKTTADSLLVGLPGVPYVLAFGQTSDAAQMEASTEGLDPYFALTEGIEGIDQEKIAELKGLAREWFPMIRGIRGVLEPLAPGPEGLIGASLIVETTDSAKWLEGVGKGLELIKGIIAESKNEAIDDEARKAADAVRHDPQAEQIEGLQVHHLKFDIAQIGELDEEEIGQLTGVVGRDGLLLRMAALNATTAAITFGGGKDYFAKLMAQAKTSAAPLDSDAGINKVAASLPKQRNAVYYIAVDQGFRLAQNILAAVDEEALPIKVPPLDAPLAAAASGGDGWVQFDLILPTELLVAGKDIIMALTGSAPPAAPATEVEKTDAEAPKVP